MESCTKGIWMWDKPLMNEGDEDTGSDPRSDPRISYNGDNRREFFVNLLGVLVHNWENVQKLRF